MPRISRFVVEFKLPNDDKVWVAETSHEHAKETCPHLSASGAPLCIVSKCSHYDAKGRPLHPDLKLCDRVVLRSYCPEPKLTPIEYTLNEGGRLKTVKLRHLTTLKLRHKGAPYWLTGVAPCSIRDTYDARKGLHYALQRALEKAGYCKLEKLHCWHIGKDGKPMHSNEDCPAPGESRIVVTSKKPIYDEVCEAFWREMRIRPDGSTVEPGAGSAGSASSPTSTEPRIQAKSAYVPGSALDMLSRRREVPHGLGGVEFVAPPETRNGTFHLGSD